LSLQQSQDRAALFINLQIVKMVGAGAAEIDCCNWQPAFCRFAAITIPGKYHERGARYQQAAGFPQDIVTAGAAFGGYIFAKENHIRFQNAAVPEEIRNGEFRIINASNQRIAIGGYGGLIPQEVMIRLQEYFLY